jgi:hypothetical protein
MCELAAGFPQPRRPGRFGRWLTDLFNEWPDGARQDQARPDEAKHDAMRP